MASNPDVFLQGLIGTTGLRPIQDVQIGQQQIQQNNQQLQMGQMAMAAAQQKAQQEAAFKQDTQTYFHNPTLQGLSALAAKYPDKADELKKTYDILDAPAKQSRVMVLGSLWNAANNGKPDLVARNLQNVITSEKAQGLDTSDAEAALAAVNSNNPTEQADAIKFVKAFAQMHLAAADANFLKNAGFEDKPYTLGPGEQRYDSDNKLVASVSPKPEYLVVPEGGMAVPINGAPALAGGGGQAPVAAQAPTGQRRVMGWSPRRRDGGDNSDAAVDGKIGALSKDIGVDPDTPLTPEQLRLLGTALPATEGGSGSLADKNNNPTNIRDGAFARRQPGYAGRGEGGFAKFQTKGAGAAAAQQLLQSYYNRGQRTIRDIVEGKPVAGGTAQAAPAPQGPPGTIYGRPKRETPPIGYRSLPDGSLEPIPGGPADTSEGELSDDEVQYYGSMVAHDPKAMPPLGMGKQAANLRRQILARAADINIARHITGAQANLLRANMIANTHSLSVLASLQNQVGASERTANSNADQVLKLGPSGAGGSAPVFNRWIQAGRAAINGDPAVSAYNAAITTFANEYAKVMTTNTGTGGVTSDSARREAESLINNAQTFPQVQAVIRQMRVDMSNRTRALETQRQILSGQISGDPSPEQGAQGSTHENPISVNSPQEAASKHGQWVRLPDGRVGRVK